MPHGWILEAEYEDGFTLTEGDPDVSPYDEGHNTFHAVLHSRPVGEHGRMVRVSIIGDLQRHDIDWRPLWDVDNPRPILFCEMERDANAGGDWIGPPRVVRRVFGAQYLDDSGFNVQETIEVA